MDHDSRVWTRKRMDQISSIWNRSKMDQSNGTRSDASKFHCFDKKQMILKFRYGQEARIDQISCNRRRNNQISCMDRSEWLSVWTRSEDG
ncbi:hypothetical protein AVEN_269315-1 [Araneus ventricosus]|uniref:Uncharacterized protein n=1 Tax=Araneus ventricosus TaxID=182803 RepID=A0A4Y2I482_ARAVE|nr:hypothetical protein AVEN_269315-1 [Araneus ventricosus]